MEKCGDCRSFNWKEKSRYSDEYWCSELRKYVGPNDWTCRYFKQDYSSSNSNNSGWTPSGFSWITLIINKLSNIFCSDCTVTTGLLNYSNMFLFNNPMYDTAIAEAEINPEAENEIEDLRFYTGIASNFVLPWVDSLNKENDEEALSIFKNMIDTLMARFGIEITQDRTESQSRDRIPKSMQPLGATI